MNGWSIAIAQEGADATPTFTEVRGLSDDEYEYLASALVTLRNILGRTAWRVLQTNFASFHRLEKQILSHGDDSTSGIRQNPDSIQIAVTTSIVNFLSTMRMFLDHSETELKRLDQVDGTDKFPSWKDTCSAEYDDYFAYRFLYRFRNYVQHVGLPVSAWNFSSSLKRSDEIVARTLAGEAPSDIATDRDELTTQIFLSESPMDLIEKFDSWKTVKEELESLTTEIDLSEQIHICMECLTRVELAFQDAFQTELSQCVSTFSEIIGDLQHYASRPLLLKVTQESPLVTMEMMDLEIERFVEATRVIANSTD